jgi:hypothetical protein
VLALCFQIIEKNEYKSNVEKNELFDLLLEVLVSDGVAQGMQQGQGGIYQEGVEDGVAAIDGIRSPGGTDAKSPSRKAKRAGKEIDDGLVDGMEEGIGEVKATGTKVGDAAVDGVETGAVAPAKKRKFGFGGKGGGMNGGQMAQMGVGMGVSALSTLPMMMGKDEIMGVSSEFTMGIGMATGQIASFSSMLGAAGPYVAGFAAVAGVAAFAMEAYTKSLDKASDEAFELGASLGGAAGAANTMAAAMKNQLKVLE